MATFSCYGWTTQRLPEKQPTAYSLQHCPTSGIGRKFVFSKAIWPISLFWIWVHLGICKSISSFRLTHCQNSRDEHGFEFKSGGFWILWWTWIGFVFYKFYLTGFGLDLIILFWTSSQLSVLFPNCRLLHLSIFCKFPSVVFLTSVEIVNCFCIWRSEAEYWHTIQWCKVQACSLMCHVIKRKEFVWLSLICPLPWPIIATVQHYL